MTTTSFIFIAFKTPLGYHYNKPCWAANYKTKRLMYNVIFSQVGNREHKWLPITLDVNF